MHVILSFMFIFLEYILYEKCFYYLPIEPVQKMHKLKYSFNRQVFLDY